MKLRNAYVRTALLALIICAIWSSLYVFSCTASASYRSLKSVALTTWCVFSIAALFNVVYVIFGAVALIVWPKIVDKVRLSKCAIFSGIYIILTAIALIIGGYLSTH
jgi:hypothetical protein